MSSWVHDWEKALIPRVDGVKAKARTQCKLGRHLVLGSVPMVWLRGAGVPLGLSCHPCALEHGHQEAVAAELARTAPKRVAPPARKAEGRTHGKPGTYAAGCRCDPCREAATAAQAIYRQRRRERQGRDRAVKVAAA